MGNDGRSWAGLFAFSALAILMAALGPEPVPESPVYDDVEVDAVAPSQAAPAVTIVASR